jgi:hypothetical protein
MCLGAAINLGLHPRSRHAFQVALFMYLQTVKGHKAQHRRQTRERGHFAHEISAPPSVVKICTLCNSHAHVPPRPCLLGPFIPLASIDSAETRQAPESAFSE